AVSVLVIVCTATGAPPPTRSDPTMIWRLEATAPLYGAAPDAGTPLEADRAATKLADHVSDEPPGGVRERTRSARAAGLAAGIPRSRAPASALLRAHAPACGGARAGCGVRSRRLYWRLGAAHSWEEIALLRRGELEALFGPARAERMGPLAKSWISIRPARS